MTKALVTFALKEEFDPWRRRHHFRPTSLAQHPFFVASLGNTEVYVTLVGAGAPAAERFQDAWAELKPSLGIVTGVAAGLKPEWHAGDVLVAQTVSSPGGESGMASDPRLLDLAVQCGAKVAPRLLTLPRIARTVSEKTHLASLGDAADMESLLLMKQWSAHGIPSLALRVILDPVDMPMTCDFEAAMDADGQVQITRVLAQLAHGPHLLPDFLRLWRMSHRCLGTLARYLDKLFGFLDRTG